MKKIFILYSLGLVCTTLTAQTTTLGYGSQSQLSNYWSNPALIPGDVKFTFGLPNVHFEMNNSFKINDLYEKSGTATVINLNRFANNLADKNRFSMTSAAQLGQIGFRVKGVYVGLGVEMFSNTEATFSNSLLKLFLNGNQNQPNTVLNQESIYSQSFLSTYLGVSKSFLNDKLTVGIRMKRLTGIGYMETERINYNIQTDVNANPQYALQVQTDMVARGGGLFATVLKAASDPAQLSTLSQRLQATPFSGRGVAADVGISYQFNDKWSASASILNLGSIAWSESNSVEAQTNGTGYFEWSGRTYRIGAENAALNIDSVTQSAMDALLPKVVAAGYSSGLPAIYYIGLTYKLNEKHQIASTFRTQTVGNQVNRLLGVNYRYQLLKSLQVSGGVSLPSHSSVTVGGGLVWSPGPVQLYLMTDNLSTWDNANRINIQMGVNIVLRKKKEIAPEGTQAPAAPKIEPPK